MPSPRVSLQLWSLRDLTAQDFAQTVGEIAQIGFAGVETAGYGNLSSAVAITAIKQAGLAISGMHVGLDRLREEFDQVVDEALLAGTRDIICPFWPVADFSSAAVCRTIGTELDQIGARLRRLEFRFHYHHHAHEMAVVEGRRGLDWLLDEAAPGNVRCQADVYWVHVGGKDPAAFIREQGRRIQLLHIRDGKEIGSGPIDFASVFAAAEAIGAVEWYVIEVEDHHHEPLESVRRSFAQMRTWGKV